MIDKTNGRILLPEYDIEIGKGMKVEALCDSGFYKALYKKRNNVGRGYAWYYFNPFLLNNYSISFSICFHNDLLHSIQFCTIEDTDPTDWSNWTEEGMIKIFRRNNNFLDLEFGESGELLERPYYLYKFIFNWGTVWSTFDMKSAFSTMGFTYTTGTF